MHFMDKNVIERSGVDAKLFPMKIFAEAVNVEGC